MTEEELAAIKARQKEFAAWPWNFQSYNPELFQQNLTDGRDLVEEVERMHRKMAKVYQLALGGIITITGRREPGGCDEG